MERDFQKVLRTLSSCESFKQIKTADNMFNNFYDKWKDNVNFSEYTYLEKLKELYQTKSLEKRNKFKLQ